MTDIKTPLGLWRIGTRVRKVKGSSWQGPVVGYYSTSLTPVGYCIESEREPGSVQIYPASALEVAA
jgi:R67 dihydrofolate reductase